MKGKFDDVKVGDKLMRKVSCGFKDWNALHFGEDFFVEVAVERVIKTRFTAGGVDYKKADGCKVGEDYYQSVFVAGERISNFSCFITVPSKCQKEQLKSYQEKLSSFEGGFSINPKLLSCSIDDALKVSDLIRQIKKITGGE